MDPTEPDRRSTSGDDLDDDEQRPRDTGSATAGGDGGTSDDDTQPDDAGATGTLGDLSDPPTEGS